VAYSKIKTQPNSHPFFHQKKDMHMDLWMFQKGNKLQNDFPLDIALENILQKFSIPPLGNIEIPPVSPLDPQISSLIKFNITPLPKPKESYSSAELASLGEGISNIIETMYKLEDHVYVDGSVDMETGRAASAYIFKPEKDDQPIMETFRISDWVSSTQAELGAIFKVLEKILITQSHRSVVIFCDSMAALLTIQSKPNVLDPLTYDIVRLAKFLIFNRKMDIIMHWIPSHIGIEYNEKVDDWAKQGSCKSSIDFVVPCS
jgi:ribonuclease HI